MFRAYVTLHSPQYPVSETRFLTWNEITRYFDNWIDGHLRKHVEEIEAPDLWKEIASRETLSKGFRSPTIDNRPFTADEAVQIKFCLGEFRQALADELNPSKEQLDFINERLAYLESAIDRLNRFDWTSVLLSSCISIATNLTVDTSRGNMILDLLYRCFRSVLLIGS
ncbi:MAG TPA: hypothetical protein PKD24_13155 [Pyrinomonadaceae bacterium]|nr:hypothetical protein [Pyrinomonadaceae bacterium]HMP67082.1 hypothetical protein [Pyrinomonadaceae bacterium]